MARSLRERPLVAAGFRSCRQPPLCDPARSPRRRDATLSQLCPGGPDGDPRPRRLCPAKPKCHYMLHLPDSISQVGYAANCFTPERRHKWLREQSETRYRGFERAVVYKMIGACVGQRRTNGPRSFPVAGGRCPVGRGVRALLVLGVHHRRPDVRGRPSWRLAPPHRRRGGPSRGLLARAARKGPGALRLRPAPAGDRPGALRRHSRRRHAAAAGRGPWLRRARQGSPEPFGNGAGRRQLRRCSPRPEALRRQTSGLRRPRPRRPRRPPPAVFPRAAGRPGQPQAPVPGLAC